MSLPEDVGRGLRFNHIVEMQTWHRVSELSANVHALLETLVANNIVGMDELAERLRQAVEREKKITRSAALVVINDIPDKYALTDLPRIDCEARLPLCRARCCTYPALLSAQDLDEGLIRWDYVRPYRLGHRGDGYCVHNDADSRACTVYEHRPAACRTHDCRDDKRIWIDFEKRVPA